MAKRINHSKHNRDLQAWEGQREEREIEDDHYHSPSKVQKPGYILPVTQKAATSTSKTNLAGYTGGKRTIEQVAVLVRQTGISEAFDTQRVSREERCLCCPSIVKQGWQCHKLLYLNRFICHNCATQVHLILRGSASTSTGISRSGEARFCESKGPAHESRASVDGFKKLLSNADSEHVYREIIDQLRTTGLGAKGIKSVVIRQLSSCVCCKAKLRSGRQHHHVDSLKCHVCQGCAGRIIKELKLKASISSSSPTAKKEPKKSRSPIPTPTPTPTPTTSLTAMKVGNRLVWVAEPKAIETSTIKKEQPKLNAPTRMATSQIKKKQQTQHGSSYSYTEKSSNHGPVKIVVQAKESEASDTDLISSILCVLQTAETAMSSDKVSSRLNRMYGYAVTGGAIRRALFQAQQEGYVTYTQGLWQLSKPAGERTSSGRTSSSSSSGESQSRKQLMDRIIGILTEKKRSH